MTDAKPRSSKHDVEPARHASHDADSGGHATAADRGTGARPKVCSVPSFNVFGCHLRQYQYIRL